MRNHSLNLLRGPRHGPKLGITRMWESSRAATRYASWSTSTKTMTSVKYVTHVSDVT